MSEPDDRLDLNATLEILINQYGPTAVFNAVCRAVNLWSPLLLVKPDEPAPKPSVGDRQVRILVGMALVAFVAMFIVVMVRT